MVALVLSSVIEARLFDFKDFRFFITITCTCVIMLLNLNCIDSFTLNIFAHVNQFLLIDGPQLH